ncbi:acyl-CoA dehydrogenase family protein [Alicyclobacillus herbarius]|uniref:acyl-CoA dehydrogenase family protein n=1 Tax=Alicyclobacillus herbarius TaxID=122960 RepID=UPI00047AF98B|nr:acyl-CoA dehydrogenase family protein [Alicyclobacillus herbarius]
MISFRPTEEEVGLIQVARDFAKERIRPAARDAEDALSVPTELAAKAAELGFLVMELPESLGGLELSVVSQVQVWEELAYGDLALVQGWPGLGDAASLLRFTAYLPNIRSQLTSVEMDGCGPTTAWLDASDPNVAWDSAPSLVQIGNGYVLRGTSRPVRMARDATCLLVSARDEQGVPVILWLQRSQSPWTVEEGDVRLGLLSAGVRRLRFDDLEVGPEDVLARGEGAEALLARSLPRVRTLQAAKELGLMRAALEYTVEYTAGRKAFGQEIAKFQGVSFVAADMQIEMQAARMLVLKAALDIDQERPEADESSLYALARAHRAARFVSNNAVQLLGGSGFVKEYPVEKWMRDAQAQVMLYGREAGFLLDAGERLVHPKGKVAVS